MKYGTLSRQMSKKGVKLRTWCKAKDLSDSDYSVLCDLSKGITKGKWGVEPENLRKCLEKEGFKVA